MNHKYLKIYYKIMRVLFCFTVVGASLLFVNAEEKNETVIIKPREYKHALKNPLKGFRPWSYDGSHQYGTLCRIYFKWNDLERNKSDGKERILKVWNERLGNIEDHNIKVIPRVYLHWEGDKKYWPSDMKKGDYSSKQFKFRMLRLIARLGECWDNDPRVAWIQMGMIGKWGEHHTPSVTPEMQKLMGDAFTKAFKNKMVTVRHPADFKKYQFGIYWDSWAHVQEMEEHGGGIEKLGTRWKTRPMGGECAYNWGRHREQPGDNPNDTLRDSKHRKYLINTIRKLHCNNLGWVSEYDKSNKQINTGAEEVQKAFGYRFVIEEVQYPKRLQTEQEFSVTFKVRNIGSSPFYANWPVELSLLDLKTRKVVWSKTYQKLNIQKWLPGDHWKKATQSYLQKPKTYIVQSRFQLPKNIKQGEYYFALAILDPAGNLPAVRFAVQNYFKGGRHPIGKIGVGMSAENFKIDEKYFDDPAKDNSLHYILKK